MKLNEYQKLSKRTYPVGKTKNENLTNFALGFVSESAEVADEIKKVVFHGHELDKDEIEKEIGDTLWYMAMLAETLGTNLETIAKKNVKKLELRYENGFSEEASRNRKI